MEELDIKLALERQKRYFEKGNTLPINKRKEALRALYKALEEREDDIMAALEADLGKAMQESYMCELGLVKSEISHMLRKISSYAGNKHRLTPIALMPGRSIVKPVPYGSVLIMSPWNYPILLSFSPLIDAIAAGNTVILKPSAYSPESSRVIEEIAEEVFPETLVKVITGGREENKSLLSCDFDYIFFTGSKNVGREVMAKAAERLIPVTLELGGKSPCFVDETADIKMAARRIVFGKLINCGQTCVAPDYIYCHESIVDDLVSELEDQIALQYGTDTLHSAEYGKIINKKHFDRISGLIDPEKTVHGGGSDEETLKIEPTVMKDVTWDDAVMQEEIFGPVIPILTYTDIEKAAEKVDAGEKPLALYIFSRDKENIDYVMDRVRFGGGCVNDTLIHIATSHMGFGGVGESGMGAYHGKTGFDTFTHMKSIVRRPNILDVPMRYRPYKKAYEKILRMVMK